MQNLNTVYIEDIDTVSAFVFIIKPPVFVFSGRVFVPPIIPIDGSVQVRLRGGHQHL